MKVATLIPPIEERSDVLTPKTYSVDEFARMSRIGRTTVFDEIAAGTFPIKPIRIGRRIMLPKQAVDRLLAGE